MRLLGNYIGKTIAGHILAVMLVLLSLYFFSTFVTEITEVGKGKYQIFDALQFSIMLLPRQVYELFPLVALMGTMLGLGALANTSELTVMRAAGISVPQIMREILKIGAVLVVIAAILGEVIAPAAGKRGAYPTCTGPVGEDQCQCQERLVGTRGRYLRQYRTPADERARQRYPSLPLRRGG